MAVVKELIENAIDAGANSITVEIKDGGKSLIRVTDNGSGISEADIKLAFTSHATSKITTLQDLLSVSTLGFRGEALASIAAVSQLEMFTRTKNSLNGFVYVIEGGIEKKYGAAGCPDGTTFVVRNLFYNTPARLKFLKTSQTEAGYISSLIEHMALSHPEIAFRFINQNQPKLFTAGNGNIKDVIYNIYGKDITLNLLPVNTVKESCTIDGFIGKPVISRGNRSYINYFINGRFIKSHIISRAVEEAYSPYMMQHKYPFTVLHFNIVPQLIDVNVHPQKMEIRFTNEKELYKDIYNTVSETLKYKELTPDITLKETATYITNDTKQETNIKIIGQVFSTYWILQYGSDMFLVDQHAAHEKVLYERFMKQIENDTVPTQTLAPPLVLSLSIIEKQILEENIGIFEKLGYCIESFGGRECIVTGVPAQLSNVATQELIIEIVDSLIDNKVNTTPATLIERVATMSCKVAAKDTENMSKKQMHKLLKELMSLENPYNCPHGRPTMIKISQRELENKFKH